MAVNKNAVAGSAAQQLVDGHVQGLALNVPECRIDCGDRAHGHGAASPIRAFIKVLPNVLDSPRVSPDQNWNDVVGEIARHGKLAAVKRGIPEAINPVFCRNLQRYEVASWATDNHLRISDLH